MIWIYTVCKARIYPGSAGLGLIPYLWSYEKTFLDDMAQTDNMTQLDMTRLGSIAVDGISNSSLNPSLPPMLSEY